MASSTDFDIENPPPQDLENQTGLHEADEGVNLCMVRRCQDLRRACEMIDITCDFEISSVWRYHNVALPRWLLTDEKDSCNMFMRDGKINYKRKVDEFNKSTDHQRTSSLSLPNVAYYDSSGESPIRPGFRQDAFSLNPRNDATIILPGPCRYLSYFDAISKSFWDNYSSRVVITSRFYPPSDRHLSCPDGRSHEQALGLIDIYPAISDPPYLHNSVVNNQNITQLFVNNSRVEGQPLFNRPKLTETFLSITSQAALALLTIWTSGNTRLSQTAIILFYFAAAFNVCGFLSCLFAILIRVRNPQIARIVTGTGLVCAAYWFLAIMAMLLNDNIMLWVSILAFVACFPALASAFIA